MENKRVIKFRAWDGEKMINSPGYEGTGSGVMIYQLDFEGRVSLTNLYGLDPLEGGAANTTISDLILMQFTGLHDKDGKEIYEGDVVECHDHPTGAEDTTGEVYFKHGYYQVYGNPLHDYGTAWTEVIGNIYESPELLKP